MAAASIECNETIVQHLLQANENAKNSFAMVHCIEQLKVI
jgi:hypothetical protein